MIAAITQRIGNVYNLGCAAAQKSPVQSGGAGQGLVRRKVPNWLDLIRPFTTEILYVLRLSQLWHGGAGKTRRREPAGFVQRTLLSVPGLMDGLQDSSLQPFDPAAFAAKLTYTTEVAALGITEAQATQFGIGFCATGSMRASSASPSLTVRRRTIWVGMAASLNCRSGRRTW